MATFSNLYKASKHFEKLAAFTVDQDSVAHTLKMKRLFPGVSSYVSPLLAQAEIPPHSVADISLVVEPGYKVSFRTELQPHSPDRAARLSGLLELRFGKMIAEALQANKQDPSAPITMPWLVVKTVGQSV
jgi:hypothetical protein